MKTTILTALVTCLFTVGLVSQADARPRYGHESSIFISGYSSCGTPIYTQRIFCGYDCYGRPIWKYRVLSAVEHRGYRHGHYTERHYGNGGNYGHRGNYGYRNAGCSPYRSRYGSQIVIRF